MTRLYSAASLRASRQGDGEAIPVLFGRPSSAPGLLRLSLRSMARNEGVCAVRRAGPSSFLVPCSLFPGQLVGRRGA